MATPAFIKYAQQRSPEEMAALIERFGTLAEERIALALATAIPEGNQREYQALLTEGDDVALAAFLDEQVEDMAGLVAVALADIRDALDDLGTLSA